MPEKVLNQRDNGFAPVAAGVGPALRPPRGAAGFQGKHDESSGGWRLSESHAPRAMAGVMTGTRMQSSLRQRLELNLSQKPLPHSPGIRQPPGHHPPLLCGP